MNAIFDLLGDFLQQPAVIAEVITGIILGPTVMGRVPNFRSTIFPTANMAIFGTFAEVGLVLFMNLVGLELDFALMTREWKSTAIISVVGIALPMVVSVGSSYAVWEAIDRAYPSDKNKTFGTYVLFMFVLPPLFFLVLFTIFMQLHYIFFSFKSFLDPKIDPKMMLACASLFLVSSSQNRKTNQFWSFLILSQKIGLWL